MAPIPIYTASPINAAKASDGTPQTAVPEKKESRDAQPAVTTVAPPAPSQSQSQPYPPAQPGMAAAAPTSARAAQSYAPMPQPTPTKTQDERSPPPPQPGAVPAPPGAIRHIPPPPRTGQASAPPPTGAPVTQMPPQMSIAPPTTAYSAQRSSTTTVFPYQAQPTGPRPVLINTGSDVDMGHPPGYHQNAGATEFSSHQRAAQNALLSGPAGPQASVGMDDGAWNTAKKWAQAAGDGLAAAESEVWKRLNKD